MRIGRNVLRDKVTTRANVMSPLTEAGLFRPRAYVELKKPDSPYSNWDSESIFVKFVGHRSVPNPIYSVDVYEGFTVLQKK